MYGKKKHLRQNRMIASAETLMVLNSSESCRQTLYFIVLR